MSENLPGLPANQPHFAMFEDKPVRRVVHNGEWHLSIVDVIQAITETKSPSRYWNHLKAKITQQEGFDQLFAKIAKLRMPGKDGRFRRTDAGNIETIMRIIQSIPSHKAEPFRQWLAHVGAERLQEIQNPGLAIERGIRTYQSKGYSDQWINHRLKGIQVRNQMTKLWGQHGIQKPIDFANLTDTVHKGTFDINTKQHKEIKAITDDLRDNMTTLELLFMTLGEESAREITEASNAQGLVQNRDAAKIGSKIAGDARRALEAQTNKSVVSKENNLQQGNLTM